MRIVVSVWTLTSTDSRLNIQHCRILVLFSCVAYLRAYGHNAFHPRQHRRVLFAVWPGDPTRRPCRDPHREPENRKRRVLPGALPSHAVCRLRDRNDATNEQRLSVAATASVEVVDARGRYFTAVLGDQQRVFGLTD